MIVEIDSNAVQAINEILRKGNKAVVQRCKDGVLIMEEKRKIKYSTVPNGAQGGNLSQ